MIGLSKFIKGCVSIKELMDLPNAFTHALFKQYTDTMKDEEKRQAAEGENMADELEDALH